MKYLKCDDCIKSDVCGVKADVEYAYEKIMTTNITQKDCAVHYARDYKQIDISVVCKSFSPKHGLGNVAMRGNGGCGA